MGYSPEPIWEEDVRLMRLAGVNTVCIGIFAWAALQPDEATYDFSWLDRVVEVLGDGGIGVCLGTATAAHPAWLSAAHPDVMRVDELGRRHQQGVRMQYCPTSPDYRSLGQALVTRLAERYGDNPALRMWHVSNEYGPSCYCGRCAARFRLWLEARYGSLAAVNEHWVTAFWGHTYTTWDQILPPGPLGEMSIQGLSLDYRRFVSDMNLECYEGEAAILREQTPTVPVFTNFHGTRDMDYFRWAPHQDVIAYDSYPQPTDPPEKTAFRFDLMRGLADGAPWLLLEQTPSQTQWQPHNVLRRPGEVRLHSYQAIARGSSGAMFYQWRQSRGSEEMHHGAIISHSGRADTRVFGEIAAMGEELATLGSTLSGATHSARVGLVLQLAKPVGSRLLSAPQSRSRLRAEVLHYYAALRRRNIAVDVHLATDTPLGQHDLVIAPLLQMVTDEQQGFHEAKAPSGAGAGDYLFQWSYRRGRPCLAGRPSRAGSPAAHARHPRSGC